MYHELEQPGRPLCDAAPGYVRYVVRENDFLRQLDRLRGSGLAGMAVSEALSQARDGVAITFDDGCETDLLVAAPALNARGFGATFYVTTGFLNRRGFLSSVQLRELADLGFEIGSHGVTHRFLPDLADAEVRMELSDSRKRLEDTIGRAVVHFSCPGGRWNMRLATLAEEAGYASVATSRIGSANGCFNLARAAVMRSTSLHGFDGLCGSTPGALTRFRHTALKLAKAALGNRAYVGLRSVTLLSADFGERAVRRLRGATRT